MNDEEIIVLPQISSEAPQNDPQSDPQTETFTQECGEGESTGGGEIVEETILVSHSTPTSAVEEDEAIFEEAASDPGVLADPLPDPDSDSGTVAPQNEAAGLDELRSQLKQLRDQLQAREAFLSRIGAECEEFRTLYPDVPTETLPQGIWDAVLRGVPLAAAYALEERRQFHLAQQAEEINRSNNLRSTGAISGIEVDYFSPEEVRAMTQSEVRANYQKIVQSMQKWH